MARVVIKNITSSKIALPDPVNRTLNIGQELTLDGVDADPYKTSAPLNSLITSHRITVSIQEDPNIDDTLEIEPLAGTANEALSLIGGGGGSSVPFSTAEALTFPIDYNDVGAFDGVIDTVFSTQASINDFLVAHGATNFRYIMDCWRALPVAKMHPITMNLAAGVHRPKAAEPGNISGWNFATPSNHVGPAPSLFGKGFGLSLVGPSYATQPTTTWEAMSGVETKQSYVTTSTNPYIVVVGTPFTPGALRGYWAFGNNWSRPVLIHDNDASTLYLTDTGSSASFTTVQVFRPSAVLRNSFNDTSNAYGFNMLADFPGYVSGAFGTRTFELKNITIEPFSSGYAVSMSGASHHLEYVLLDAARQKDLYNITFNGQAFGKSIVGPVDSSGVRDSEYNYVSVRGAGLAATPSFVGTGWLVNNFITERQYFLNCYAGGLANGFRIVGSGLFEVQGITITDCSGYGILVNTDVRETITTPTLLRFSDIKLGTVIRNCAGGLDLAFARVVDYASGTCNFRFEGLTGPAMNLREHADVNLTGADSIVNRNIANSDYGFRIVGPFAHMRLPSNTTVSGTLGEVLLDGSPTTYAAIVSGGPIIGSTSLNRVEKAA